jgi:predicted TIM-barrel fold metal-dependent hydrolase
MPFEVRDRDMELYRRHLADFLPARMIDVHTHVWLNALSGTSLPTTHVSSWPDRVADENPIDELLRTYELMFPAKRVTPVIFGFPRRDISLDQANGYVADTARLRGLPALMLSTPEWSAQEVERRVEAGGFCGLKPYLSFAPSQLAADQVTVYDFLPRSHLEVADQHGWLVMLHIPRSARLKDAANLQHLLEIERRYPRAQVVVAHIGRAYCREDVGSAFDLLRDTEHLLFDISANTNAWVMEQLIRSIGPRRILFGRDLPILRMRMRRICENGMYVNLVPPGLYGDISGDAHMREVSPEQAASLSFFMYEELLAFRAAAEATGLTHSDLDGVFFGNAATIIARASGGWSAGSRGASWTC